MKETRIIMGMPVTVEAVDESATQADMEDVFSYFNYVDEKFSLYKTTSEITAVNECRIKESEYSADMKEVFALSEKTRQETDGYFNISVGGKYNPSGLVKGWAIYNAAQIFLTKGLKNFYIEAGGDIQVHGHNSSERPWSIGIRNPFVMPQKEIVKVVYLRDEGIATSGTYIRGEHIYNPRDGDKPADEIMSMTVIGPNVYEADRFATAAFAMGQKGIEFIEHIPGLEGYMIDKQGLATMTTGFVKYTEESN